MISRMAQLAEERSNIEIKVKKAAITIQKYVRMMIVRKNYLKIKGKILELQEINDKNEK